MARHRSRGEGRAPTHPALARASEPAEPQNLPMAPAWRLTLAPESSAFASSGLRSAPYRHELLSMFGKPSPMSAKLDRAAAQSSLRAAGAPVSARGTAGFTLLELMVVLAILGALAFVATPPFLRY